MGRGGPRPSCQALASGGLRNPTGRDMEGPQAKGAGEWLGGQRRQWGPQSACPSAWGQAPAPRPASPGHEPPAPSPPGPLVSGRPQWACRSGSLRLVVTLAPTSRGLATAREGQCRLGAPHTWSPTPPFAARRPGWLPGTPSEMKIAASVQTENVKESGGRDQACARPGVGSSLPPSVPSPIQCDRPHGMGKRGDRPARGDRDMCTGRRGRGDASTSRGAPQTPPHAQLGGGLDRRPPHSLGKGLALLGEAGEDSGTEGEALTVLPAGIKADRPGQLGTRARWPQRPQWDGP